MTVPKWLIPVIAAIAALAVGTAGVLIGMRFALTETVASAPETQIVPVLAPIATGDEAPVEVPDGTGADDEPVVVSEVVAEREVTVPAEGTEEADDPTLVSFLGLIGTWPDALLGLINFDADERTDGDDPCSPAAGDPPTDCPEGLRGAIFSDTALRDFSAGGQAYPPTYAEYLERGNPFGGSLWCDGLDSGGDEVPFGILATAPGHFTVRYWPTDDPADTRAAEVTSSPAQEAAWQEQVDLGDEGFAIVQECLTLPDIRPDTAYTATVTGIDTLLRIAPVHTTRFHSGGAPLHPGLQITPVGENLVFASALFPRDESVVITAGLVGVGEAPSCDLLDAGGGLPRLTDTTVAVSADDVNAVNAIPSFNQRRITTFVVPEGGTAVVCARWFPSGDAPAWESAQRNFESSAIVQAPDRLSPEVTLESISSFGDALERIDFQVSSAEGIRCFSYTWSRESDSFLPARLCSVGVFEGGGTAADDGRLSTRGFGGDLVIEATAHLDTGETSTTSYLIPSPDGGCRGDCPRPDRQWYRIALADVEQGIGLCGSFFGSDCEPPTQQVSAGTAMFFVDWLPGLTNGRESWNITPTSDRSVDYVAPDFAQFDQDGADWSFTTPTPGGPWSSATLPITVDRPVDYRLTFTNPYAPDAVIGVGSPSCITGAPLETSGRSIALGGVNSIRLSIEGLCLSAEYFAQLELTDDSGRTTVWGVERTETWWGATAFIRAPGLTADLRYEFRAQSYSFSYVRVFDIELNGASLHPVDRRSGRCLADGITESNGIAEGIGIYNQNTVTIRLLITDSTRWGDAEAWDAECLGASTDETARVATFTLTVAELFARDGIELRTEDLYGARLRLFAVLVTD
jgi:hypothetical protein